MQTIFLSCDLDEGNFIEQAVGCVEHDNAMCKLRNVVSKHDSRMCILYGLKQAHIPIYNSL